MHFRTVAILFVKTKIIRTAIKLIVFPRRVTIRYTIPAFAMPREQMTITFKSYFKISAILISAIVLWSMYQIQEIVRVMTSLRTRSPPMMTRVNRFQWLSSGNLDTILHPCQSQTIANLPLLPTQPHCPNQYLLFYPFGQLNNALRSFVTALIFAAATHRTVVLTDDFNYPFSSLLNWTHLCAVEMTYTQIQSLYNNNNNSSSTNRSSSWSSIPCITWDATSEGFGQGCGASHQEIPLQRYIMDVNKNQYSNFTTFHNVHCIVPLLPQFPTSPFITMSNIFFSGIPKSTYMSVLQHIDFTDAIKRDTDTFIQKTFANKKYVGLHVRWLNGACVNEKEHYGMYAEEYEKHCFMSWDFLSEKMKEFGYDPNTVPIFLATDNERPDVTQALLNHSNVVMFKGEGMDKETIRMIDMCLLAKSSLFIGGPFSSMSFHVALLREIQGHPVESNVLASYRETGYLHHLFME